LIKRVSSLVNTDRDVAISSGEMYPALGIFERTRVVRSLADDRSRGSDGNEIPNN
jgi:hypothetical protein